MFSGANVIKKPQ